MHSPLNECWRVPEKRKWRRAEQVWKESQRDGLRFGECLRSVLWARKHAYKEGYTICVWMTLGEKEKEKSAAETQKQSFCLVRRKASSWQCWETFRSMWPECFRTGLACLHHAEGISSSHKKEFMTIAFSFWGDVFGIDYQFENLVINWKLVISW